MECTISNNKLVTLQSAVNAAITDKYGDAVILQHRFSHWACRELKMLYFQLLPQIHNKVLLTVNANTHTATLPLGFSQETFVGGINEKWEKVPFKLNNNLVDSKNITDIPCEDKCPKCAQDTSICNDLVVTEDTEIVLINGTPYNKTIIKKLYPNGDYYLETSTPTLNINTDAIDYIPKKEFIAAFDLKPCGCLDTTPANIITLQTYCPDIYCNYYAPCNNSCYVSSGYRIFEESGLIQFDPSFPYDKVYLEYNGFVQKIKGQYYIPSVAFETVVEGIKRRAIKDKPNVTAWQILNQKQDYKEAKGNLMKILSRFSLSYIVQAISQIPKFDIDYGYNYHSCFTPATELTVPCTTSNLAALSGVSGGSSVVNEYITIYNNLNYTLAVKAGTTGGPTIGYTFYQNNLLAGAYGIEYVIYNKQLLTVIDNDITIDYATGRIDFNTITFFDGDTVIINYNKLS